MAFSRSRRFVGRETCAPPPTAYQLPSTFDENNGTAWIKPCTFDHQCCHKGLDYNNKSNETACDIHEKGHSCIKSRASASSGVNENKENICCFQKKDGSNISRYKKNVYSKVTEAKTPSFMTRPRHSSHNCFANKSEENVATIEKNNFNRHSLKRKSMRLTKENKNRISGNLDTVVSPPKVDAGSNRKDVIQSCVENKNNYKLGNGEENAVDNITSDKGAIPKKLRNITDDMKQTKSLQYLNSSSNEDISVCTPNHSNLNLAFPKTSDLSSTMIIEKDDVSQRELLHNISDIEIEKSDLSSTMIIEKDDVSQGELLNNLSDIEIEETAVCNSLEETISKNDSSSKTLVNETARKIRIEIENAIHVTRTKEEEEVLKASEVSDDIESHVVFLISEEFIDDDYDSYLTDITLEKLYAMNDSDLFKVCKTLIRSYRDKNIENNLSEENTVPNKINITAKKETKTVNKNTGILNKKKRNNVKNKNTYKNTWNDLENIVRSAITKLKGEFKNDIYKETEEKVDSLLSKLAKVLLKTNEDIEKTCERTTVDLIRKLEKIVK